MIGAEKRELEKRLAQLNRAEQRNEPAIPSDEPTGSDRPRRKYPKVLPNTLIPPSQRGPGQVGASSLDGSSLHSSPDTRSKNSGLPKLKMRLERSFDETSVPDEARQSPPRRR